VKLEIVAAFDFPGAPEVVEDGQTLEVNSLKKAESLSRFTVYQLWRMIRALFVEALEGRPGYIRRVLRGKKAATTIMSKNCFFY